MRYYEIRREFHIRKAARDKYGFDLSLYQLNGNAIIPNFNAARSIADAMNRRRDAGEKVVAAGQINAMGLIDEINHYLFGLYRRHEGGDLLREALAHLDSEHGREETDAVLSAFLAQFPPLAVYRNEEGPDDYLSGSTAGEENRLIALEELIMLRLENENRAFRRYSELIADEELKAESGYEELFSTLEDYLSGGPGLDGSGDSILEMLRKPGRLHPDSLQKQLEYIRTHWGRHIGGFLFRILSGYDLIREDERLFAAAAGGPALPEAYTYDGIDEERERFSHDKDWMPRVVLLAKSTLVWLDQLAKKYRRQVDRLDQIPDEELDLIASEGFNALWLIGLWERSPASRRIKQLCGNPEAEASAYSLLDYRIADALGGWDALGRLRERCLSRGIVLASDMVPNHTGIDSRWVEEHPDWFIQLPEPPYPSYRFSGENLSRNPGIGVFLEDHYFDKSDAAVVFKREDFGSGDTRYIYHGNDGTHMPWNDTAQINFLNPEAREAVIQTILHVARNFPLIRFDAAMTLAKRHYRRLWFPDPGSGGDIPSRAEHGMSRADFDRAMPLEFWREVVDRVAEEAPDTLLLAEAFWMMEGYFVRSLGMHRVYNSAFMHMMKNEDNAKYRTTIKNTIEFDPEILKRFVNFMNNPDEETAVAQFGKGDKYFGVATMMVTMPGLPMFGHGQIEGFTEKYGMEYSRAYWDETPDEELIERHRREIFPLMKKRYLFAGVDNFCLFDFYSDGGVNENVFAFSNRAGHEAALVLYNNAYESSRGWIRVSAAFKDKGSGSLEQKDLAGALAVSGDARHFVLLREQRSGLWYIRNSREIREQGFYQELSGYQCRVYTGIHEVEENQFSHYSRLAERLGGGGVPDIDRALKEMFFEPLFSGFSKVVNPQNLDLIRETILGNPAGRERLDDSLWTPYRDFLESTGGYLETEIDIDEVTESLAERFSAVLALAALAGEPQRGTPSGGRKALRQLQSGLMKYRDSVPALLLWLLLEDLYRAVGEEEDGQWIVERQISRCLAEIFDPYRAGRAQRLCAVLFEFGDWYEREDFSPQELFSDPEAREYMGVNAHEGVLWFNKEAFEQLFFFLSAAAVVRSAQNIYAENNGEIGLLEAETVLIFDRIGFWTGEGRKAGYRVEAFIEAVETEKKGAGEG
jgi:glycosidase